jgi:hypothetical protein
MTETRGANRVTEGVLLSLGASAHADGGTS